MSTTNAFPHRPSPAAAIQPAIDRTIKFLFKPFRFGFWARIALLGILTGELATSGGCNLQLPAEWGERGGRDSQEILQQFLQASGNPFPAFMTAGVITALIVIIFLLTVGFLYFASIGRFVLFETIVTGTCSIRAGWRKWHSTGLRFFQFNLLITVVATTIFVVVIGIPFFVMTRSSGQAPPAAMAAAFAGLFLLIALVLLAVALALWAVYVLIKDFLVPLMALENMRVGEGLRRLWTEVKSEPGNYFVYLLLKIALNLGAALAFGILIFIVALVIAVPLIAGGALIGIGAKTGGLGATAGLGPLVIALIFLFIAVGLPVFIYLYAFISAPVTIFFPSYAVYFFAARYTPLAELLYGPPPIAPPDAPPALPPPEMLPQEPS